jgi:hypothetical protein
MFPQEPSSVEPPRDKWPNAVRDVHLAGGLRALNNARQAKVQFLPRLDATPQSFEIADYSDLFRNLRQDFKLRVIGCDLVDHQLQVHGHMPPMWLPFHEDLGGLFVMKVRDLWSDLGTGGLESDNLAFIDLSHRVKFQIDSSAWRLRDLSNAYFTELNALVETRGYSNGKRIDTMNSFAIEIAVHSLLTDLATLRDYLAEFIAQYVFRPFRTDGKNIRLMAKLKSEILPHMQRKHEIVPYLEAITADNGWLKILSDYRDLAVHYSPLSSADYRAWVVMKTLEQPNGIQFPSISMSLPADPAATKRVRSKFDSSASWRQWQRENFGKGDRQQGPDTLQYCHEMLGRMVHLAFIIGNYSPIAPKKQTFNSSNSWNFRATQYTPRETK